MRIVLISDTHSHHRKVDLPEGDVLVHCGDITWRGELDILGDFAEWMAERPFEKKIVVFGNHEVGFQDGGARRKTALHILKTWGIDYLEDSGLEHEGVKFWGSPWQPEFCGWEFNLQRGAPLAAVWAKIPLDTDVLVTHGPPYGILDRTPLGEKVGCEDLFRRVRELPRLKLHAFGHIHDAYGDARLDGVTFVNAATCDERYRPVNPPIEFDLPSH